MCVLHRPPSTGALALCDQLADYMERNINSNGTILLFVAMNTPSNQQDHPDIIFFKDVLVDLILHSHILLSYSSVGK